MTSSSVTKRKVAQFSDGPPSPQTKRRFRAKKIYNTYYCAVYKFNVISGFIVYVALSVLAFRKTINIFMLCFDENIFDFFVRKQELQL